MEYCKELYYTHNHYPLCPERMLVQTEWLSPYQQKSITDLNDKHKYTAYYKNLQLYLQLGPRLKKIHKVFSFTQEYTLRDYINRKSLLLQKAKAAKDDFGANINKTKNNGVQFNSKMRLTERY